MNSIRGVVVHLTDGDFTGRGEAQGVFYQDENADSLIQQVNAIADEVCRGIDCEQLRKSMPAGGARNAIDCALWDLEAKRSDRSIWELTGISPRSLTTVFTIGLEDSAEAMAAKASAAHNYPKLKIKLDDNNAYEKLQAIRAARPDADIVVDANQGWSFELLQQILPRCVELNISMIEQPLPRGEDALLDDFVSPLILCADESCLHLSELDAAVKRYSMINIKLDKTGGLTEALLLAKAARERGCHLMIGNMLGTSLSMAPSFVIAQLCDYVDIDGPLLLRHDHPNGLTYQDGFVTGFDSQFWG